MAIYILICICLNFQMTVKDILKILEGNPSLESARVDCGLEGYFDEDEWGMQTRRVPGIVPFWDRFPRMRSLEIMVKFDLLRYI